MKKFFISKYGRLLSLGAHLFSLNTLEQKQVDWCEIKASLAYIVGSTWVRATGEPVKKKYDGVNENVSQRLRVFEHFVFS